MNSQHAHNFENRIIHSMRPYFLGRPSPNLSESKGMQVLSPLFAEFTLIKTPEGCSTLRAGTPVLVYLPKVMYHGELAIFVSDAIVAVLREKND